MKLIAIIFILLLLKIRCLGAIPTQQVVLDINAITPVAPQQEITAQDVAKFIPTSLTPTNDGSSVGLKIAKQAAKSLLKSDAIRNSSVGKTAESVKEGLSTEMSAKASKDPEE